MNILESNDNIYLLVNYTLGSAVGVEELQRVYPTLVFQEITEGLFTVQVPPGQEEVFKVLREKLNFITEPAAYGLNAQQALEVSNISIFHEYPYGELRGRGVLIGFVDTGIDYLNPLFQNADGTTRIKALWDQTIPGAPPDRYQYGSVYTEEMINRALQSADPETVVPSKDEIGHGTFLAGVAAGNDQTEEQSFVGGAPDAGILMVKMRQASAKIREFYLVDEGVPVYQSNDILTGISFLMEQAYNQNMPLIICIGVGNNFGAHNGSDILEGYLSGISTSADIIDVVAAGNEGNAGHHYKGTIQAGVSDSVEITVGENEKGVVLYFWAGLPNRIELSVKSPLGQVIDKIPIFNNKTQEYAFKLERTQLSVTYLYPEPFTGSEAIIIRLKDPTPGIWTLNVLAESVVTAVYHVWMSRKGFISETTRFLKPDPEITVQIPGTEMFSIVVGAYDYLDDSIYVASGRGPTTNNIIKPDLLAPGVNVQGPRPGGGFTTYVGTSTAAAITASACALLMQWAVVDGNFPQMNTRIARGILTRGARRQKGVTYPNNVEGYGRLDLQGSINTL